VRLAEGPLAWVTHVSVLKLNAFIRKMEATEHYREGISPDFFYVLRQRPQT